MKKLLLAIGAMVAAAATALAADYTINNLEELREFMEAVHVEDFAGDTITLTADIDCEGGRFNTGDPEYPSTFRGTFDGGGHVISNFVHAATGSTQEGYGVAMFDFAETGAAILNLTLEGTLPGTARGAYAAPFVLAVESPLGLFMDNCHFRGSVTNYYHAAGLVGFASSGTGAVEVPSVVLTNCSVRGEIVSTWVYTAGGLVAKATGVQAFDCSVAGPAASSARPTAVPSSAARSRGRCAPIAKLAKIVFWAVSSGRPRTPSSAPARPRSRRATCRATRTP